MLIALFVTASLLAQAWLFRDIDDPRRNEQVTLETSYLRSPDPAPAPSPAASDISPDESDSSRTAEPGGER